MIQTARAEATLAVRSVDSYPLLISSLKAKKLAPSVAVLADANSNVFFGA